MAPNETFTPPALHHPPHPEIHHVHPPHQEVPPPPPHYIHPDVIRAEEERKRRESDEARNAIIDHPLVSATVALSGAIPMAWAVLSFLRQEMGWMALLPPFWFLLLVVAGGVYLPELVLLLLTLSAFNRLFPGVTWSRSAAPSRCLNFGAVSGAVVGVLVWIVQRVLR